MKLIAYVEEKEMVLKTYQICYEVQDDRFKSLRLSKGQYPKFAKLDYQDKDVEIKENFHETMNKDELKELLDYLKIVKLDDEKCLKENWFSFKAGEKFDDVFNTIKNFRLNF